MATITASNRPSSKNKKRILWFWQSNSNLLDEKDQKQWTCYSHFENEFLEKAYQRNDVEVQLNDCIVNFKRSVQFEKDDPSKERMVKREEVDSISHLRAERFAYPERASKPFINNEESHSEFVNEWHSKNIRLVRRVMNTDYASIVSQAAEGILKEGRLLHKELDALQMGDALRNCTRRHSILKCAARLYSLETFLYKIVNLTLRNDDRSKIDTLGAFCYLLQLNSQSTEYSFEQIIYRGMILTDEMIEDYRKAVGTKIQWLAFTSTSKVRAVAEAFGNTLFIIRLVPISLQLELTLSSVSHLPEEQELLLPAGQVFLFQKIEFDSKNGKYSIYMRSY